MAALPTVKQLSYLIALADELNFTRAAASCFVTQSTLSAGLKELEKVLNTQLLERDRQNVLMTPTGLEVSERARAIVAATQDLVEIASARSEPMTGQLRVGIIPTIAPFLLPQWMPQIRQQYPKLQLILREDTTANLLFQLEGGQLDFALIALPYDTGNFLVTPLFDDNLWIVGRRDDPQLKPKRIKVSPALSDQLLLLEEGHCLRDHALYACGASNRGSSLGVAATSLLTLVQMVESGIGIGLIPEMAVKSGLTQGTELLTRSIVGPAPKRTIALVARRSSARLAALDALAELILQIDASVA